MAHDDEVQALQQQVSQYLEALMQQGQLLQQYAEQIAALTDENAALVDELDTRRLDDPPPLDTVDIRRQLDNAQAALARAEATNRTLRDENATLAARLAALTASALRVPVLSSTNAPQAAQLPPADPPHDLPAPMNASSAASEKAADKARVPKKITAEQPITADTAAHVGLALVIHAQSDVFAIAASPDSTQVATGRRDGSVAVWDGEGYHHRSVNIDASPVMGLQFSPSGYTFAALSLAGRGAVYSADSDSPLHTFQYPEPCFSLCFNPVLPSILAIATANAIVLRDVPHATEVERLHGHTATVLALAYSTDGTMLASAGGDGATILWHGTRKKTILAEHIFAVRALVFHPHLPLLASGNANGEIILWDAATGACVSQWRGHNTAVTTLAFSPDGAVLASAGGKDLCLWDWSTQHPIKTLGGPTASVQSVAFTPTGTALVSGGRDKALRFWKALPSVVARSAAPDTHRTIIADTPPIARPESPPLEHGTVVKAVMVADSVPVFATDIHPEIGRSVPDTDTVGLELPPTPRLAPAELTAGSLTLAGHADCVTHVVFHPQGTQLASSGRDGVVRVWGWEGQRTYERLILAGHHQGVHTVAYNPAGAVLASGGGEGKVMVWDTINGALRHTLDAHTGSVRAIAFSPNGAILASVGADNIIALWDARTYTQLRTIQERYDTIYSLAFSPNSKRLASAGKNKWVRVFDTANGKELRGLSGHDKPVFAVAYSPNGRWLASAGANKTIVIWDATAGSVIRVLQHHTDYIHAIAFTPDGNALASASSDTTITIWDVKTWTRIRTIAAHHTAVKTIAYNVQGTLLASGAADGSLTLWNAVFG